MDRGISIPVFLPLTSYLDWVFIARSNIRITYSYSLEGIDIILNNLLNLVS
jgi:hypothetical protein